MSSEKMKNNCEVRKCQRGENSSKCHLGAYAVHFPVKMWTCINHSTCVFVYVCVRVAGRWRGFDGAEQSIPAGW